MKKSQIASLSFFQNVLILYKYSGVFKESLTISSWFSSFWTQIYGYSRIAHSEIMLILCSKKHETHTVFKRSLYNS